MDMYADKADSYRLYYTMLMCCLMLKVVSSAATMSMQIRHCHSSLDGIETCVSTSFDTDD